MIGTRSGAVLALVALAQFGRAQAPEVTPPQRFERILWCADLGAAAPRLAEHGFTGVQLGRGGDPAKVTGHGLGYYLDQPVGKGVFELRDAQFDPLRLRYEQERDPTLLVRPGCFATPGLGEDLAVQAAAEAKRVAGPGLRFIALADEPSATRHDAPLDTCWCEHCLLAFRRFARARFASVGEFNTVCGTQFESFDDVRPMSTDQVRRRELGDTFLPKDLRAWSLRLDFVDQQFAAFTRKVSARVIAAVPGVPVGFTGTTAPAAFGGGDPARYQPFLTLAEPYRVGGAVELTGDLTAPGAHRYATLFGPGDDEEISSSRLAASVRTALVDLAVHGTAGVVVWNDQGVFGEEGRLTPFGRAVRAGFEQLGGVLNDCAGAVVEPGPIWVVESQPSVRAWWMLDSAEDGLTWVRRLASYEATHSTSQAARKSWIWLLRDLGFQPHFVVASELPMRLAAAPPKAVVLPATIALEDRVVRALAGFARRGGTVLCDHTPALYDEQLQRREKGGLDALFGIRERSLRWQDLLVRQGRRAGRSPDGLPRAERGLRAAIGERHRDGDTFAENHPDRGHAVYLNASVCEYAAARLDPARVVFSRDLRRRVRAVLQRAGCLEPCDVRGEGLPTCVERVPLTLRDGRSVLAIRIAARDDLSMLQNLAGNGPRDVRVELPRVRTLRHLRGETIGTGREFDLKLDPLGALFLEVVEQ